MQDDLKKSSNLDKIFPVLRLEFRKNFKSSNRRTKFEDHHPKIH